MRYQLRILVLMQSQDCNVDQVVLIIIDSDERQKRAIKLLD